MLKKIFSSSRNSVLLLTIMLSLAASRLLLRIFDGSTLQYSLAAILLQLFCFTVPTAAFLYLRFGDGIPELHLSIPRLTTTPVVASSIFMMISGAMLIVLLGGTSEDYAFSSYNGFDVSVQYSFGEMILTVVAGALVPAILEELVFRGIFSAVYSESGAVCAASLSTLFFSLVHMNLASLPVFVFAGTVLWILFASTRSIYAPITVHFFYNLFCMFGLPYINAFYGGTLSRELFIFILTVILLLSCAVFFAGLAYVYRKNSENGTKTVFPHSVGLVDSLKAILVELCSVSTLLCVAIFLAVALLM